jgi:hypothetical protein
MIRLLLLEMWTKSKQIVEFIQANKFDPDELDKQMMGYKTNFEH